MQIIKLIRDPKTHALLLGSIVFFLYLANTPRDYQISMETGTHRRLMSAGDIVPNTFLPYSLISFGHTYFDEIINTIRLFDANKDRPYFIIQTKGHHYSAYPILTGLMATPIYLIPIMLSKIPEVTYHENILKVLLLGRISASFYATLSVVLFYYTLKHISKNNRLILLYSLFYAFGTSTWSISSRGLWQHTISQFFIAIVVLVGIIGLKKPKVTPWLGFFLGLAVVTRPTNVFLALVFTIYVFIHQKVHFKKFVLFTIPSVLFLLVYNQTVFGDALSEGYGARNDFNWSTPLSVSLPAYALSPARSFLFISPPLVLAFWTMYKMFIPRGKTPDFSPGMRARQLYKALTWGFLGSMLLFAKWYTWDGAPAFGNRMLADFVPILGVLSFETVQRVSKKGVIVVGFLIMYSITIHFNAVYFRKARCSKEHNWTIYCLLPPTRKSAY